MREETRKTARVQAGEEALETVNEKTLMDQLDSMKTAFRGYDKEATCELLQTLIRSMETEKNTVSCSRRTRDCSTKRKH